MTAPRTKVQARARARTVGRRLRRSSFLDPLDLQYLDGRIWRLITPFDYDSTIAGLISVPVGFVTDFASVPRFFWRVLPPTGRYGKAAVVHDYLYGSHLVAKPVADRVFLEAMTRLGVNRFTRSIMYWAVRLFGGTAYAEGPAHHHERTCHLHA